MTLDYESLPQRPSRAKRARLVVDGGEAGNAAGTDAAAAGGARAPGAPPPLPDAAGFELASRPDTDGLDRSGGEAGKGGKGGRDAGTSDDGDGSAPRRSGYAFSPTLSLALSGFFFLSPIRSRSTDTHILPLLD